MKENKDRLTPLAVIGLILYFIVLIGGTVLCICWGDYGILVGFIICWLVTIAYAIRGITEASG